MKLYLCLFVLLFVGPLFLELGSTTAQEKVGAPAGTKPDDKGANLPKPEERPGGLLWLEILAFFVVAGAFGGVLAVLQPLPQASPGPLETGTISQPKATEREHFKDYFVGAIGGVGGSIAGLAVMLVDGRISNSVPTDTQRLSFICAGVLSGYLGFGLLQMVADRFNRYLRKALEQSEQLARETERRTETLVQDSARLSAAVSLGMIALNNDPAKVHEAIRALEGARHDFPDDRPLHIVLARLYRREGHFEKAIEVLNSAEKAMRNDPAKAEGVFYNRSIYHDLLAEKTTDPARKAELKAMAIADLKQSIALLPENYQEAVEDKDFDNLRKDPRFESLKP